MCARRWLGSSVLFTLLVPALLGACAAATTDEATPEGGGPASALPAPAPGESDPSDETDAAPPPPPPNECKLSAMTGVTAVTPHFVIHTPPEVEPPAMTGGALDGKYTVDAATVFLPTAAFGLVDPETSTGTVTAWAIFDGTNYRLHLQSAFTLETAFGQQSQGADTASHGGFTTNGAALTLDHACTPGISDTAAYSFTDQGGGRATLLIKTSTPYGDTYLQLDAAKD
jgi:hypothetical protein